MKLRLPHGEGALHPLLLVLGLVILVVEPMLRLGLIGRHAVFAGMFVVMLSGIAALDEVRERRRYLLLGLALAALSALAVAIGVRTEAGDRIGDVAAMLGFAMLAFSILHQTMAPGRVTARRIEGAVAGYLLVGLFFASAFALADSLVGGAFRGVADVTEPNFIYFSFITLTTTGYGEITPEHPVVRALAVAEALFGQLYLAILIARLVSLQIAGGGER